MSYKVKCQVLNAAAINLTGMNCLYLFVIILRYFKNKVPSLSVVNHTLAA